LRLPVRGANVVSVHPRSVLIADDDPGIRDSLRETLDREGWETWTAEDGREAVEVVRIRVVRVALVDMRMPDMTGLETLRELRRVVAMLPVIAMTADRDRWARDEVVAAGAFDLLWKPLRRADVVGALERALRAVDPRRAPGKQGPGTGGGSAAGREA
jgi:DNA-binding NtrC family response regulator